MIMDLLSNESITQILNLGSTAIGPLGIDYIVRGLKGNKILIWLDLSNNNIGQKIINLA